MRGRFWCADFSINTLFRSVTCGSLYCKPPTETMVSVLKMTTWRIGKCFTAFSSNITMSPELDLTPNGASCGDGKVMMVVHTVGLRTYIV